MRIFQIFVVSVLAILTILAGCSGNEPSAPPAVERVSPQLPGMGLSKTSASSSGATVGATGVDIFSIVNAGLESKGESYRLAIIEYITSPGSGELGSTVFAKNVGNKQLGHHFVYGDPRRSGRTNITYIVDRVDGSATGGLGNAQTEPSIDHAAQTWNQQSCSPVITKVSLGSPVDLGYVEFLLGYGGVAGWAADVTHAGWLPGTFFDEIQTGGSSFILGVTFTFLWVDGSGNLTDIDRDGKLDVAFREIYYNNAFSWSITGPSWNDPEIDVESIALHEMGHGLSQGHFGKVYNDGKGTKEPGFQLDHLHFSPRAVMNAVYWETQRDLLGTDQAGHCSIWSSWEH